MKHIFVILLPLLATISQAQDKQICITVDDLPVVTYGIDNPEFAEELTRQLVSTFRNYEVPAIGYVNEVKLYENGTLDSGHVHLLELWLEHGLELGNHTYSHPDYHQVSFDEFTADILKGEQVTPELVKEHNSEYRYFRHPYLRMGLRQSHADSLESFLAEHGYTDSPVTIDNEDYIFALAYHKAYSKNDSLLMKKIGSTYVDYMEEKLLYFEEQSHNLFGRHIAQTLLTHANLLNAHYMDDLIEVYQKHGYTFISQKEVLEDDAYNHPVTVFGDWGISWIDRWALSQGKQGDFFKDDPATPEFIQEIANNSD